jgi:hypothetical protein
MHENVNIDNKMLSLVFNRVIKEAIIITCNAGCLYHPIKHQSLNKFSLSLLYKEYLSKKWHSSSTSSELHTFLHI